MIPKVKCCATCRRLQLETKYCHKKQQTRFNILGDVDCEFWAWGYRGNWKNDTGRIITKPQKAKISFLDAVEMGVV